MNLNDSSHQEIQKTIKVSQSMAELHPDWLTLMTALKDSGVALELNRTMIWRSLDTQAARPPKPHTVSMLLSGYFSGNGHVMVGLRRQRLARYIAHYESDMTTAHKLVARIGLAAQELHRLVLSKEQSTGGLKLRSGDISVPVDSGALDREKFEEDGKTTTRSVVTVRGLIATTNRILAQRELAYRFVPLAMPQSVEAFVGVTAPNALILNDAGALDDVFDDIAHFAAWEKNRYGQSFRCVA